METRQRDRNVHTLPITYEEGGALINVGEVGIMRFWRGSCKPFLKEGG